MVTSYSVKHTNVISLGAFTLSNPSKSVSQNVLLISLALSGRKLKNIIESLSFILPIALPSSFTIAVGITNSSVLSF